MTITDHISQLLYRYQCVTIPGFGAFLAETVSAKIQESNQTFYPPKKEISFNYLLRNNDGLLANQIAMIEKTSYDNAVVAIDNIVFSWKTQLENERYLFLRNIGELRLNQENKIVFSPNNQQNYLIDAFGLNPFVSRVIKREEYKQQVEALEEVIPIQFTPEKRNKPSYLKYAAIFLVTASVTGFAYKGYIDSVTETETLMVQKEVQKEVENKIQEATFFINSPVTTPAPTVKTTAKTTKTRNTVSMPLHFHIMAGAFKGQKNAKEELDKLVLKGYKARILPKNKHGLIPVVYGSYATYIEAEYNTKKIQNSVNKEAWLLIDEN